MTKPDYWKVNENSEKEYYGVCRDEKTGEITRYTKLTSETSVRENHDTLFMKLGTGVIGYHGDTDKVDEKQYGKDFDDFENNYGRHR